MGGFTQVKRFKFMSTVGVMDGNGSIEIKPTTQLILHPTTDLVASPEGSFIVRTTASFEGKIKTIGGGNVLTRRKVSVKYTDFSAGASRESRKLLLASFGDTIVDIIAKLATPFKYDLGPATVLGSIYKVSVGDMSNLMGYNASALCGSSVSTPSILFAVQTGLGGKGSYLWNASGCRISKVMTANASIEANFNASGGTFLGSLSQGALYFYIDSIQNP